jgi:hypothetical protein
MPDMRAISSVNLLLNDIGVDQAEDLVGIFKEHPTLKSLCGNMGNETELDMSGKMRGAGDAIMLVAEIVDNGAISSFTFSGNDDMVIGMGPYRFYDGNWKDAPAVTMETSMTEADFSGEHLGVSGAIMLSAFLPKCM